MKNDNKSIYIGVAIIAILIFALLFLTNNKENNYIENPTYRFELKGEEYVTITVGETYNDPGYKVYDQNNMNINIKVDTKGNVDTNKPGTYEIKYLLDNEIVGTRYITVQSKIDETSKENNFYRIDLLGEYRVNLLINTEYIDPFVKAKQKSGEDVTKDVRTIGRVNNKELGTYEIHYRLETNYGPLELVRKVTVVDENVKFELIGEKDIEIETDGEYLDEGIILNYNVKDYSNDVKITNNVDKTTPGEYQIIYTYTTNDFEGSLVRNVIVNEKPRNIDFRLLGEETITIEQNEEFIDPLFTAFDEDFNDYKDEVIIENDLDVTEIGEYFINYKLIDGKNEYILKRKVIVVEKVNVDFSLNGAEVITISVGDTYIDQGYTCRFNNIDCDYLVTKTGNVSTNASGVYEITYTFEYNNVSRSLTRTIIVEETVIEFFLNGNSEMDININGFYVEPGYIAKLNDKDIREYVEVSGIVNTKVSGIYEIKYHLHYNDYDKTLTRKVNVKGNNYTVSVSNGINESIITIRSNTSSFDHYITPRFEKVYTSTLTYKVTSTGKYTFMMFDKNNNRLDMIEVNVSVTKDYTVPTGSCLFQDGVITVTASDASGIQGYSYNIGNGYTAYTTSNRYTSSVKTTQTASVKVKDNAGNIATINCTVKKDTTPPSATCEFQNGVITTVAYDASGIEGYSYNVGSGYTAYTTSSKYTSSKTSTSVASVRVKDKVGNIATVNCTIKQTQQTTPTQPTPSSGKSVYFIGDSRTVGMCSYVSIASNEDCSIAKISQGYSWLNNTALPALKKVINKTNQYTVVINLGTNDLGNASKYASLYNNFASEYRNVKLVIVSVTPINDEKAKSHGYSERNSRVITFNNTMKSSLNSGIKYCDVYSKIINNYSTNDGIHYTSSTYKTIYQEIKKCM